MKKIVKSGQDRDFSVGNPMEKTQKKIPFFGEKTYLECLGRVFGASGGFLKAHKKKKKKILGKL